jgi:hypothetical protein
VQSFGVNDRRTEFTQHADDGVTLRRIQVLCHAARKERYPFACKSVRNEWLVSRLDLAWLDAGAQRPCGQQWQRPPSGLRAHDRRLTNPQQRAVSQGQALRAACDSQPQ